jgi:aspartate 1-decarboxylase
MEAASILPFEQVHVNNLTNGVRLQTYVVEGSRGSGTICINGAAAKHVSKDDLVIILAYDQVAEPEAHGWRPTLVYVDDKNQITRVAQDIQAEKR